MSEFEYLSKSYKSPPIIGNLDNLEIPYKPGYKIPNGAIILAEVELRRFDHRRDSLVLCVHRGFEPFVSWVRVVTTDSPLATGGYQIVDTCAHGNYYRELTEAIESFNKRVEDKLERVR